VFPGNLPLTGGMAYQYYFEVIDNDAVNNYKSTKSQIYGFTKLTQEQEEQQQLKNQKESLSNLEKSLEEQNKQQEQKRNKLF